MPPRPKYTKDEIIEAAYELMEEKGIEAVVAREVGKRLGTTTGPIFTFFKGMDELKEEVYIKAIKVLSEELEESFNYAPAFKEFGLRLIKCAKEHPNLFNMVFFQYGTEKEVTQVFENDFLDVVERMKQQVADDFSLEFEQASDIVEKMAIYVLGIASMIFSGKVDLSDEELSRNLGEMCLSLVTSWKLRKGELDGQLMISKLNDAAIVPKKNN